MNETTMLFRNMKTDEYGMLKDFVYEAIFIPEGVTPPDRSIVEQPELAIYYKNFGSGLADYCIVAEDKGTVIGAVWTRIIDDYGHVDDETPSLGIAVLTDYRRQGIGTRLLKEIKEALRKQGVAKVSLSVQKENYAVRMYKRAGFRTTRETEEEYIMVCKLC